MRTMLATWIAVLAVLLSSVPATARSHGAAGAYPGWRSNGPIGAEARTLAVDASNSAIIYAGTDQGILKSSDAGLTWLAAIGGMGKVTVVRLVANRAYPNRVYAATWDGLFRSDDAAESWRRLAFEGKSVWDVLIDPRDAKTLYATVNDTVMRSDDEGRTWTAVKATTRRPGTPMLLAMSAGSPVGFYVGVEGYGIFRFEHNRWVPTTGAESIYSNGMSIRALAVDPADPRTVYASFPMGDLAKTSDGGRTWRRLATDAKLEALSITIDPTNPRRIYLGAAQGVYRSVDGGERWIETSLKPSSSGLLGAPMILPLFFAPVAIDPNHPDTVYAATGRSTSRAYGPDGPDLAGFIYKSTDAGVTWTQLHAMSASFVSAVAADPRRSDDLYAGTPAGIYASNDAGEHWRLSGLTNEKIQAIAITHSGAMFAGTRSNGVFEGAAGEDWHSINAGLSDPHITTLRVDHREMPGIYAGTPSGLFHRAAGETWTLVHVSNPVHAIEITPDDNTLYVGITGGLIKSTNGGAEWTPSTLRCGAHALALDPAGTIYAGTDRSVFKSTDGGATWQAANTGMERAWVHALMVDPDDPRVVYAGTIGMYDHGGVFRSLDAGASWQPIGDTDVNQLTLSVNMPRRLFVATDGDGVAALSLAATSARAPIRSAPESRTTDCSAALK